MLLRSLLFPDEVYPIASGRDRTITQFPEGIPYLRPFVYGRRVGDGSDSPSYHSSRAGRSDMSLLDYIRTADPQKVQAVEVQKGEDQVKLLDSIKHCFVSLDAPAVVQQEGGSVLHES
ncbi:hypothetical protein Tco_0846232 [Tanacetum coccineum]